MQVIHFLLARLSEPSSWAALAAAAAATEAALQNKAGLVAALLAGLAGFFMSEKGDASK